MRYNANTMKRLSNLAKQKTMNIAQPIYTQMVSKNRPLELRGGKKTRKLRKRKYRKRT